MNLEVKDNGILQIESILMKDFLMPHYDHNKNVFTIHVWGSFFTCVCLWFFWGEGEGGGGGGRGSWVHFLTKEVS